MAVKFCFMEKLNFSWKKKYYPRVIIKYSDFLVMVYDIISEHLVHDIIVNIHVSAGHMVLVYVLLVLLNFIPFYFFQV